MPCKPATTAATDEVLDRIARQLHVRIADHVGRADRHRDRGADGLASLNKGQAEGLRQALELITAEMTGETRG